MGGYMKKLIFLVIFACGACANREYQFSTNLDTSQKKAYEVLIDFGNYKHWNSLIPEAEGHLGLNELIHLKLKFYEDEDPDTFEPVVTEIHPPKHFILSKGLGFSWLGLVSHSFELLPLQDGQIKFTQKWLGSGLLIAFIWPKLSENFDKFKRINHDLSLYLKKKA